MKLLVLDIDDTAFDWLEMWRFAFERLLQSIIEHGVEPSTAVATFRKLHVMARTSERGIGVDDVSEFGIDADVLSALAQKFESELHEKTVLFPSVLATLGALRQKGVAIAAHTDSPAPIAEDRLVRLGLDGQVDALFATASAVTLRRGSLQKAQRTPVTLVEFAKPDPRGAKLLLERLGVLPHHAVYVGDSKMKDIPLARAVGMTDVHASYGCRRSSNAYDLLRSVSHWTDEDIQRERSLQSVEPSHSIVAFDELLSFFD